MEKNNNILTISNVSKKFPGIQALDDVSLNISKGEVHAIVGENGAGKSTLMNIVMGIFKVDKGSIFISGKEVNIDRPKKALDLGLSMVAQEINLVPLLSIAENISVGRLSRNRRFPFFSSKELYHEAKILLEKIGLKIDPKTLVKDLSISHQQMVQIAKSLSSNSKIIIMDEPTSSLSEQEIEQLFEIISVLKTQGISIIYISHKLDEVFRIADRVTVLRDGKLVDTLFLKDTNEEEIISLMVGRSVEDMFARRKLLEGNVVFRVENLAKIGFFEDINFELRSGEIIGFYGLVGSGRTELALSIFGVYPGGGGRTFIGDKEVKISSPIDAIKNGIGYLSEDRKNQSIFPILGVRENITISNLRKYCEFVFINSRKENKETEYFINKLDIRAASLKQKIMNLSGGNQQKAIIARLLALKPRIMILDEPTRGIDVGAKAEVHFLIEELAESGMGIIIISSELPEIFRISDRIIVMRSGRISGVYRRNEATQEELLKAASPIL